MISTSVERLFVLICALAFLPGAQVVYIGGADVTPPAAPTGLTPTAGDSQVSLAWSHASPGDVDEYVVEYRCPSGSGSYTEDARPTSTSEIVSGLTNGVECDLRVAAEDAADNLSAWAGPVQATPEAAGAFLRLEDSTHWGPGGAVMDLTDAIPVFRSLDEEIHPVYAPALPLDTTGWSAVTPSACTEAAIQTAVNGATACNVVIDISACSNVNLADDSQAVEDPHIALAPSGCRHGLVLRGDPVNRTTMRVNRTQDARTTAGSSSEVRESGFALGSGSAFELEDTFTWDTGREMNSTIVGSNNAITGVYEGDILEIGVTPLGGVYASDGAGAFRFSRRVLCAKWNDGTEHPAGCGATYGISTNNRIKIDFEITSSFETTGPYRWSSLYTGHFIRLVERMGFNGNPSTNNDYVYLGIENVNFEHDHPFTLADFRPAIRTDKVLYAWIENVRVGEWGATKIQPGRSASKSSHVLIRNSELEGETWKTRCIASITGLAQTNPVQLTINTDVDSGTACRGTTEWNGTTLNPVVYIDPTCSVEPIRGLHGYDVVTPWSGGNVTISLPGINGAGLSTSLDCYAANQRYFGVAAIYADVNTNGVHVINNSLVDTKVGLIVQGGWDTIAAYNECYTRAGAVVSRCLFNHEGHGPLLWEGNVSNAQYLANHQTAHANGPGRGPHTVKYRNHFLSDGVATSPVHGDVTNSGLGHTENAMSNMGGSSAHYDVIFGNVIGGRTGSIIDSVDNNDNGNTAEEIASGGPYYSEDVRATGNLYRLWDGDSLFSSGGALNPTTLRDNTEADEGSELSEADRNRDYPESLVYKQVPSWWCLESGTFPGVGAPAYTASTPPNIPAMRVRQGLGCTLP